LDREAAVSAATSAFGPAAPVEVMGEEGIGKTALLGFLAHHPAATAFSDGVVYLSVRDRPVDDLLRSLFDAFYETDLDFHPTDSHVRHALQGKRALVLLDDVTLSREQIEVVLNAAPSCAFVIASGQRVLWAGGTDVDLRGLPPDDGLALLEQRVGRSLADSERDAGATICEALDGHPLRLVQAASLARDEGRSLYDVAIWAATYSPVALLDTLSESERSILAMLASVGDWPVPISHIAGLTGIPDAPVVLQGLDQRGLVHAHSPRYSPAGTLGAMLRQEWDLDPWRERALGFCMTWAEREHARPRLLLETADVALHLLEWAAGERQWQAVLRLGRAIEAALALGGRWAAWVRVLRLILQAARALAVRGAEAWALHQIGTRAMCLGSKDAAREALTNALQLRQSIGDRAAAAVTKHNLDLLLGPPAPPKKKPPEEPKRPPTPRGGGMPGVLKALLIFVAGVVFVGGVVGGGALIIDSIQTPDSRDPEVTPYPTERPTERPVEEPTPTPVEDEQPEPWVEIELLEGCGTVYLMNDVLTFEIRTNVGGQVDVYMVGPDGERIHLFEQFMDEDASERWEWDAPSELGEWELVAELNGGEAEGRCGFVVDAPPPVIEGVAIITVTEGFVCPDDEVVVRAYFTFVRPLERVLFWFRDPPDTGIWFSDEMTRVDDWSYSYIIEAREQPGIEFYVFVEDVDGRSAESEPQIFFVDPCVY
jgi:hypothetical protein